MTFHGARLRLTLWYAGTFLVVFGLLSVATYVTIKRALDEEFEETIEVALREWEIISPALGDSELVTEGPFRRFDDEDAFVLAFDSGGALVGNPHRVNPADFEEFTPAPGAPASGQTHQTVTVGGTRYRLVVEPWLQDGRQLGTALAGRSLAPHDREIRDVVVVLGTLAGIGLIFSLGGGYLVSGRALRPLEDAYERQRRFVGDASHELRSPIAVIQTSADLLLREQAPFDEAERREVVEQLREVAGEAGRLVDELLELAQLESPNAETELPTVAIDLADATSTELERLGVLLREHDTPVTAHLASTPVLLLAEDAHRIVRALIENVLAHTPNGTAVTVRTSIEDGKVGLLVEDDGPGVPEALHARIFDRFVQTSDARTPSARSGSGLGLAIVRAIAIRNRGRAVASPRPGGGLRIVVTFPAGAGD